MPSRRLWVLAKMPLAVERKGPPQRSFLTLTQLDWLEIKVWDMSSAGAYVSGALLGKHRLQARS